MSHLNIIQNLPYNRFPARAAGNRDPAIRMTVLKDLYSPATLPDHGLVPFRDLGRPDGESLFQFFQVRSERGFEKKGRVERIPFTPVESNENIFPDRESPDLLLVVEHFCPPATLVTAVKEPSLRDTIVHLQFGIMIKQCSVPRKELRMTAAPFVHEFPEGSVRYCLTDPGNLGKCDVKVVEREKALAVRGGAEFFGSMGPADSAGTGKRLRVH